MNIVCTYGSPVLGARQSPGDLLNQFSGEGVHLVMHLPLDRRKIYAEANGT